jgi:hypothetical protein
MEKTTHPLHLQEGCDSGGGGHYCPHPQAHIAPKGGVACPCLVNRDPKQFLVHVHQALDAIWQKSLLVVYEKVVKDKEECTLKFTKATETLLDYTREDMNPTKEKVVQKATEAGTHTKEAVDDLINQVFQLYSNLHT